MHSTNHPSRGLTTTGQGSLVPRQANSDDQLVELWLHGRGENTERACRKDSSRFLDAVGKPLHQVTLADIQGFADQLADDGLVPV